MDVTIQTSLNETNVHCYLSMKYLRNWWHMYYAGLVNLASGVYIRSTPSLHPVLFFSRVRSKCCCDPTTWTRYERRENFTGGQSTWGWKRPHLAQWCQPHERPPYQTLRPWLRPQLNSTKKQSWHALEQWVCTTSLAWLRMAVHPPPPLIKFYVPKC